MEIFEDFLGFEAILHFCCWAANSAALGVGSSATLGDSWFLWSEWTKNAVLLSACVHHSFTCFVSEAIIFLHTWLEVCHQ